jgi:hypothetical protein
MLVIGVISLFSPEATPLGWLARLLLFPKSVKIGPHIRPEKIRSKQNALI